MDIGTYHRLLLRIGSLVSPNAARLDWDSEINMGGKDGKLIEFFLTVPPAWEAWLMESLTIQKLAAKWENARSKWPLAKSM